MLEVRAINKSYEGQPLLRGVSFQVAAGETVQALDAGTIRVDGKNDTVVRRAPGGKRVGPAYTHIGKWTSASFRLRSHAQIQ